VTRKQRKMRFVGNYEVSIIGHGVFAPGWEGPADEKLLETTILFEEVKEEKKSKESEE
jgi:hypothetical protein